MHVRLLMIAGSLLLLSCMASAAVATVTVPEPSTLAMAGVGAVGIAGAIWRKIRQ
jgi:hypothetical protein